METLDLTILPSGLRYEDTYGSWLNLFKRVAESPDEIEIVSCPPCWAPLMFYLGGKILSIKEHFLEDKFTDFVPLDLYAMDSQNMLRELVEMYSALKPELVDALYKSDMEWNTKGRRHKLMKQSFKVTCNGSFFRPEVINYLVNILPSYVMSADRPKCVLVPCAADKPYPAEIHKQVRAHIPDDYEIIIATGVLGLVPESLWGVMPLYDSGLPYQWRLMNIVSEFFTIHHFKDIVVYSDFYASAIFNGLRNIGIGFPQVDFIFSPFRTYLEYEELLSKDNLNRLALAVRK